MEDILLSVWLVGEFGPAERLPVVSCMLVQRMIAPISASVRAGVRYT